MMLLPPALLFVLVFAPCLRFAARVPHKAALDWASSLLVGSLAMAIGLAFAATQSLLAAGSMPIGLFGLASFAAQVLGGGWLVGIRASHADGSPVRFPKGLLIFLAAYLLIMAAAVIGGLLVFLVGGFGFKDLF